MVSVVWWPVTACRRSTARDPEAERGQWLLAKCCGRSWRVRLDIKARDNMYRNAPQILIRTFHLTEFLQFGDTASTFFDCPERGFAL
jgi:hypothetical protein